jgi:hypothetical protein
VDFAAGNGVNCSKEVGKSVKVAGESKNQRINPSKIQKKRAF